MPTSLEIAKDLREQAAKLIAAADILDPPKKVTRRKSTNGRRKSTNGRKKRADGGAPERVANTNGVTRLDMGTAGHTTAGDPDARALAESLVHTTEEPA